MKHKNKIELLNDLLKTGGLDGSIAIRDFTSHVGKGSITVQVDLSFSQEIEIDLGDVGNLSDEKFSEMLTTSDCYDLAGKIAGILTNPKNQTESYSNKDTVRSQIDKEINALYKGIVDEYSDQIYDQAWDEFFNEFIEGNSDTLRDHASMDFYDENYEHGLVIDSIEGILNTNPIVLDDIPDEERSK